MRNFTDEQRKFFEDLGFEVLKTKATLYPDWVKDRRNHLLVKLRREWTTTTGPQVLELQVYTMGTRKYGTLALSLPYDEATPDAILQGLRKNTDHDISLAVDKMGLR